MFAMLRVNGEKPSNGMGGMLEENGFVTVEFDWDAPDEQWRCAHCDVVFETEDDAEDDQCPDAECVCTGECPDDHDMSECQTCEAGDMSECDIAMSECVKSHELAAENKPLGWVNSAGMEFSEDTDSVSVSISTGDPRGAFVMTIRRLDDGRLVMHVPYPGMSFSHEELTEMHTGTYQVGHRGGR